VSRGVLIQFISRVAYFQTDVILSTMLLIELLKCQPEDDVNCNNLTRIHGKKQDMMLYLISFG